MSTALSGITTDSTRIDAVAYALSIWNYDLLIY